MISNFRYIFSGFVLWLVFFGNPIINTVYAQVAQPVTTNTTVTPPYTTNLSDYVGYDAYRTNVMVTLNDLAKPSWNTRLMVTIEGNGFKIFTRPDFRPVLPFVIYRDQPNLFTGRELEEFFNNSNTVVEGGTRGEVFNNNKLPEGFYNLCIEVLDYNTGKLLSNKSCAYVQMQLPNVPLVITPRCGAVISTLTPQQILFQWNPAQSVSGMQTEVPEYQLTIYEITDKTVDPAYAIQNNKALLVFTSDWLKVNNYLYTISDPTLDRGKRYVFRVQAKYDNGEIEIKNNGYSEPCNFYYGYPPGGKIETVAPIDSFAFGQRDLLLFSWNQPDNLLSGQRISYEITMVKLLPGQSSLDALENNNPFYYKRYPETLPMGKFEIQLPITLDKQSDYVWKVMAYTENQSIAESKIMYFHGPALLDKFYIQNHIVYVDETYNGNMAALNGTGKVSIGNGKIQQVHFNNIDLRFIAGNWVLMNGEILQELTDTAVIVLDPKVSLNNRAYFHPSLLRLNTDGLSLRGYIQWPFSHATTNQFPANVYTQTGWFNYNSYTLIGTQKLTSKNQFTLLEPYDYKVELNPVSEISIYKNQYQVFLHGQVVCPTMVSSAAANGGSVNLPFKNIDQLYYFTNNGLVPSAGILPVRNLQLQILPSVYTFDFSEARSPGKQSATASWKGIYFDKSDLVFLQNFDRLGQMSFMNDTRYTLEPLAADSNQNYLDSDGLTFQFFRTFDAGYSVSMNTFSATINNLRICIVKSVIENSSVNGNMFIPFISTQKKFSYTCPLTSMGLNPGYMTDLENYEFVFHPDKNEEKLNIKILRAVFSDKEKLDMSLQVEWPFLGITLESVTDFYAWGDYRIGFYTKNGSRYLDQQIHGRVTDYDYTVSMIGAGRGAGSYAFGFSGNVVISNDISGSQGAPILNLYSTSPNSMIPVEADTWFNNSLDTSSTNTNTQDLSPADQVELVKNRLERELRNSAENTTVLAEGTSLNQYNTTGISSLDLPDTTSNSTTSNTNDEIRGGLRAKLTDKEYEVLEQFVDEFINIGAGILTTKIEGYSNQMISKFNAGLDVPMLKAKTFIDKEVHKIVDTITIKVARTVSRDGFDPSPMLLMIADTIGDELAIEINRSMMASVNSNVRAPVVQFIKAQMVESVNTFLVERFKGNVNELMSGEIKIEEFTETVLLDIPAFLLQSGESVVKFVSPKNVTIMIEHTTLDAIRGIDLRRVGDRLTGGLLGNSGNIITNVLENMTEQAVNTLVQNVFASSPTLNAVAPPGVQMNFNNLGDKISEGRVDQIITLDPTNIAMNTKFVSFSGSLRHSEDEVYGNVWRGAFNVVIKQPKPFGVEAIFLSGKKDETEYWFCQVSPGAAGAKPGGKLDKRPKPFSTPATIGPIKIVAGTGRVYKHMREISNGTDIVPDPSIEFGAYFNLLLFDVANNGKTARIAVEAEYILTESDGFTIDFDGTVSVLSEVASIERVDPNAMVNGHLHLYFNSGENHFLASAEVTIIKPGAVCGGGSFLLETKPGFWRLAIGNREVPIQIIPCCNSWGALGWLYVDQEVVEIGAGIGFYARAGVNIKVGPLSGGIGVDAGVELRAWVQAQYRPTFVLNEVGVVARGWVHVYVFYSTKTSSGSFDLVDVEIGLEGVIHVNPKPSYVDGKTWGHIKVLIFKIDFEAGFHKEV